jgi:pectinesterase
LPATPKRLFFFFGKLHPFFGLNHNLQFVQTRATSQMEELRLDGHRQASPCAAIFVAKHEERQCIVTAQGKKESRQALGFVVQGCNIVSDPAFFPMRFECKAYLGRPWKAFSSTIIMETHIDDLIQPEGWLPWVRDFTLDTCFYAEFQNTGLGANTTRRVSWPGVKKNITCAQVLEFTAGRFFLGDEWIREAQVPYTDGMITS